MGCRLSQSRARWCFYFLHPPPSHRSSISRRGWQTGQCNSSASSNSALVSLSVCQFFIFAIFFSAVKKYVLFPFTYYEFIKHCSELVYGKVSPGCQSSRLCARLTQYPQLNPDLCEIYPGLSQLLSMCVWRNMLEKNIHSKSCILHMY